MSNLKSVIKKSKFFQYKKSIEISSSKEERLLRHSKKDAIFAAIKNTNIIFKKNDTLEDRLHQIEKLFNTVTIDTTFYGPFIYFLDEKKYIYSQNEIIDNIPFNYELFIDNGLNQILDQQYKDKEIGIENIQTVRIVSGFIDRICDSLKHSSNPFAQKSIECLQGMKTSSAKDITDALQRILFWNQLLWQTGHKLVGLGRLDKILSRFYVEDGAEELIKQFLNVLHNNYYYKSNAMLGDTGQVIILGGLEENGEYFCNKYTYMILESIMKMGTPDPKALLRVSDNMPVDLLDLACKSILTGCGSPLLSNDNKVIKSLMDFGYAPSDAYNYGVSACWEPLSIGNSLEQNNLFNIEFGRVINEFIVSENFDNCFIYDDVVKGYKTSLEKHIKNCLCLLDSIKWEKDPLLTLSVQNCMETNKEISEGGAVYNNYGLLSVGLSSAINSLLNIRKYVFLERKYSLNEIKQAVINDFENSDKMKSDFEQKSYFGSLDDESIKLTQDIMDFTELCIKDYRNRLNGKVKFGLSSPAYVNTGKSVGATADGRKKYAPFPTHISNEKDYNPIELMQFSGALDYGKFKGNGNVVDMIVSPALANSGKFVGFIKSAIKVGFYQSQFNIITYKQLVEAKMYPERYPDLIVRVWGFSAYFRDVPEEYQDALIERARVAEAI